MKKRKFFALTALLALGASACRISANNSIKEDYFSKVNLSDFSEEFNKRKASQGSESAKSSPILRAEIMIEKSEEYKKMLKPCALQEGKSTCEKALRKLLVEQWEKNEKVNPGALYSGSLCDNIQDFFMEDPDILLTFYEYSTTDPFFSFFGRKIRSRKIQKIFENKQREREKVKKFFKEEK